MLQKIQIGKINAVMINVSYMYRCHIGKNGQWRFSSTV